MFFTQKDYQNAHFDKNGDTPVTSVFGEKTLKKYTQKTPPIHYKYFSKKDAGNNKRHTQKNVEHNSAPKNIHTFI